jgi:hypothetical protein
VISSVFLQDGQSIQGTNHLQEGVYTRKLIIRGLGLFMGNYGLVLTFQSLLSLCPASTIDRFYTNRNFLKWYNKGSLSGRLIDKKSSFPS